MNTSTDQSLTSVDPNCVDFNKLIKVEKGSAFSLIQQETYIHYNTCTDKVLDEYKTSSLAQPMADIFLFLLVIGIIYYSLKLAINLDKKAERSGK